MSLFLKIFLWFWLAIALIVGSVTVVNWSTQTEPLTRQWQTFVGEAVLMNSQTALQIYEAEGVTGLNTYLNRIGNSERISGIGFFDASGKQIGGTEISAEGKELMSSALESQNVEFTRLPEQTLAAKALVNSSSAKFVYVVQFKRPPPVSLLSEIANRWLQILALILTAGLVCYALARYLSSPLGKLRMATQKLAGGDLQTRVANRVGRRRDEFASLARDFDVMAERIESLITSQQRLTQDISHELRSPLARMNVALEIARQKSNTESEPMLARIETESTRLNEMISRILMLAKLESGADDYEQRRIDLSEIVKDVAADADFEAQAKGKFVEVSSADKCIVMGSENLLRSAIENVLRNAVRYTADKTVVDVSLLSENGRAVLKVSDHGGGVPEAELANLFRPFYRVGEDRTRKTGGIGLGLAIAERAVKAHKGTIIAKNYNGGLMIEIGLETIRKSD